MVLSGVRWIRNRARGGFDVWFGSLERRVLDALWQRGPSTVRDLQEAFPEAAYTTLMTTLDRLHRKGVLDREKDGRAFVYRPRYSRDQLRAGLVERTLESLLDDSSDRVRPVVSFLVDAISRNDREALDDLERLVRECRRSRGDRPR